MIERSTKTSKQKATVEQPLSEMKYESNIEWRYMKKLRSETEARHWHVKAHNGKFDGDNQPILEDFNILQVRVPLAGERLYCYRATKSGRPIELTRKNLLFDKLGDNYLHGIEYLLRVLEGQDISELRLDKE